MCEVIKVCEKHGLEYVAKLGAGRPKKNCIECKREVSKAYEENIKNNPESFEKRLQRRKEYHESKKLKIKSNPELYEQYKLKSKHRWSNYKNSDDYKDKLIEKSLGKYSNIYCIQCDVNRIYGKIKCDDCKTHNKNVTNKLFWERIKSNPELLAKRREIDRLFKRDEEKSKNNSIKYRQSETYKQRLLKNNEGKFSDIICCQCNLNRVFGKKICDNCNDYNNFKLKYNYESKCIHCNNYYGLDVKYTIRNEVIKFNSYCSLDCNIESKKVNKKIAARNARKTEWYKNRKNDIRSHKKRLKSKGGKYELVFRKEVFKRYNYICQGCNVKCVHPNKQTYNQDNCATLDHVIPVSKGGSHTYDNLTLLCRKCNTLKRDKINYFENKQKYVQLSLDLSFDVLHSIGNKAQQMTLFEPM